MTTRSDVEVYYHLDPRLIVVDAPSTEMTMQDLHDTLQDIDDEPANMVYPHLVQSAGKDDLGGGVTVGITLTLRNAQIAFARRENIIASGTVTQDAIPGFTSQQLINASGTFVTDGVSRGMWVSNNTQYYPCEVMNVDSETQLTVLSSTKGTWASGDAYTIWETAVCDLTGGNLVATDYDGNTIGAVFPTYGNTVTKTSSSSATLSAQEQLQYSTFDGGVHVNLSSTYSGTTYPIGTPQQPVNNFSDALTIAQTRGFTRLYVRGSCTIDSGLNFSNLEIIGESQNKSTFTISSDANVTNCEFSNATIQGTLDGGNVITDCSCLTLNYIDGIIQRCLLLDTITLNGIDIAFFLDCWSGIPGNQHPVIDLGGSGSELIIRNYNGGIKLQNHTGTDPVDIDLNSGQIEIDNTITAGTVKLRGVGTWTNEDTYSGGANIISELITFSDLRHEIYEEGIYVDMVNGHSGTAHPRGTFRLPVNNWSDALVISSANLIDTFILESDVTLPNGYDFSEKTFIGKNAFRTAMVVSSGAIVNKCDFEEVFLTGQLGEACVTRNCWVQNVYDFTGVLYNSLISQNISLGSGNASAILNCYGDSERYGTPTVSVDKADTFTVRQYNGALNLTNKKNDTPTSIDMTGRITIQDTCASGTITLRGVGEWENKDTYAGSATVIDQFGHDVNVVRVSGEIVSINDFKGGSLTGIVEANVVQVSGIPVSPEEYVDANIIQVSGELVTLNDFVGEAASLTTTGIANAVWNKVMDAGYTAEETTKIMLAALAGKLSGAGTTEIRIRDVNDTKDRIVATVTPSGNRTVVTLDGS